MSKKILRGLAVGGGVFLISVLFYGLGVLRPLEWKSWDLRLKLFAKPQAASSDIVLVLLDQETLDVYEKSQSLPWPWPRQMYEAVVRYMKAGGAKAVFLDLIMSEGSRYGVEDDDALGGAMKAAGNVFLPFFLSAEKKPDDGNTVGGLEKFSRTEPGLSGRTVPKRYSATLPVDSLLRSAVGAGNVRFSPDGDAIFRRIPLLFALDRLTLPALPLALAEFVKGPIALSSIPLDESGCMIIRYHGPARTYKAYSAGAIINSWAQIEERKPPQIDPKEFAGKVVLFGLSAPGLLDLRPSPISAVISGTEIQAAALDNLLSRDFIRTTPRSAVFLYLLALSLLCAVGVSISKKIWKIAVFFILCLALPAAASAAAFARGRWLDLTHPHDSRRSSGNTRESPCPLPHRTPPARIRRSGKSPRREPRSRHRCKGLQPFPCLLAVKSH